jgi:hypothetical protein
MTVEANNREIDHTKIAGVTIYVMYLYVLAGHVADAACVITSI